jgi:hypothetical protein
MILAAEPREDQTMVASPPLLCALKLFARASTLLLIAAALILPRSARALGFTVINVNDGGAGSLRQAILDANARPGADTIGFNILGAGPHTIELLSVLPTITDAVTIDGYTQPGAQSNTRARGSDAKLLIELSGRGNNGFNMYYGLKITAGNTTIRGLAINRFGYESASTGQFYPGIILKTNGGNTIAGNYIGVDTSGTINRGNGGDGVQINNVSKNSIGGAAPAARNVIAGNGNAGVWISGTAATTNTVQGNYIGVNAAGTAAIGNLHGIIISEGANNLVGGTAAGAGNVISGNGSMGLEIDGPGVTKTLVQGNYIGTGASGTTALGNYVFGVRINGASGNIIGGAAAGAGNVISGNLADGINMGYIGQGVTRDNIVQGNRIGTDVSGAHDLGNAGSGVVIAGATNNLVGGSTPGAGNQISGNDQHGIFIDHEFTQSNIVQGNIIGATSTANGSLGNTGDGVHIENAHHTLVGGLTPAAGNVIAYNGGDGVEVGDTRYSAVANRISSNAIFSNTLLGIQMNMNRQAAPALQYAYNIGSATRIRGHVTGQAGSVALQFFASRRCDDSGFGEGESLLGAATVVVTSSNQLDFVVTSAVRAPLGRFITALATDASNNTSTFSNCARVVYPFDQFLPIVRR